MELENLGRVNEDMKGYQELFRCGDEYVVVSTVGDLAASWDRPENFAIGRLSALFMGTAMSGEETMAFRADESGEIRDWCGIAVANGDGSRERVLALLVEASIGSGPVEPRLG